MKRTEWFERQFPPIEDNGLLPAIIERLAGTPARLEEIMKGVEMDLQMSKSEGGWSIRDEIGHLGDLEPLWLARVDELAEGASELRPADLTNRATHEANHNSVATEALIQRFREERRRLTEKLWSLTEEQLAHSSLHPRLKQPMRVIDLAYFVSEHDDHHLAAIREILAEERTPR